MTLIGPFTQLLTMDHFPEGGPINDDALEIIPDAGIVFENGIIQQIGSYKDLDGEKSEITAPMVALPGFIDAHTHICFAGSRARDYALRLEGHTYQEIAARGGGILDTVQKTREATCDELVELMLPRVEQLRKGGVTTCEVKSGYGLTVEDELKMLEAISRVDQINLIPTCLAAHTRPWEFNSNTDYLNHLILNLFPKLKCKRVDIFVEKGAFSPDEALPYLMKAKEMGFEITIHADQFTPGGAALAAQVGALSADHLEVLTQEEQKLLKEANISAVVLPGASLGLGIPYAPVRSMLDAGLKVAIASDWNPGSAPMGDLLTQAALLGVSEKLTMAETLAGITVRAANALNLKDRGVLKVGMRADLALFRCKNFQEILYHQGTLKPSNVLNDNKNRISNTP